MSGLGEVVSLHSVTKTIVAFELNGDSVEVAAPAHWTLLEAIRHELRLTGTKQGCDKGDCGACTVLVDGQPKLSCLTLLASARDRKVTTIEGLCRDGQLDPVQDAFDECGALQCGFCQSGMMISARALLNEKPQASLADTKLALSGNLCRCTGYTVDRRSGSNGEQEDRLSRRGEFRISQPRPSPAWRHVLRGLHSPRPSDRRRLQRLHPRPARSRPVPWTTRRSCR